MKVGGSPKPSLRDLENVWTRIRAGIKTLDWTAEDEEVLYQGARTEYARRTY